MRTTLDLAPDLLIAIKKRAAELHKPIRSLVEAALRGYLSERPSESAKPKGKINWCIVDGGLPDVDISSREKMHDWLRAQR